MINTLSYLGQALICNNVWVFIFGCLLQRLQTKLEMSGSSMNVFVYIVIEAHFVTGDDYFLV